MIETAACQNEFRDQGSSGSILLVEDNDDARETLTDILSFIGYAVASARNGKEALTFLENDSSYPCVILLDWMMPVMSGDEFLTRLRQVPEWNGIPVVILSAVANTVARLHAHSAQGYLTKPVDLDRLMKVVRENCEAGS